MSRPRTISPAAQGAARDFVADVVERLKSSKKRLGSCLALERAIGRHPGNPEHLTVERRKLARLLEGAESGNVALSMAEWIALDRYFRDSGGIFRSLRQPRLADAIRENDHAIAFVGSRAFAAGPPHGHIDFVSLWDMRAAAAVRMIAYKAHPSIRFDLDDLFVDEKGSVEIREVATGLEKRLQNQPPATLISIGSPRTNPVSEVLLREFFPPTQGGKAPFGFLFRKPALDTTSSLFCEPISGSGSHVAGIRVRERNGNNDYLYGPVSSHSYGIVCAKIERGGLRVVLAGDIGPSTLACARVFDVLPNDLSREKPDTVAWCLVKATLASRISTKQRDERDLVGFTLEGGAMKLWRS